MLVGRARDLEVVEERLAEARSRRGCLLFVGGEPGIGKTALASVAREQAQAAGMTTAWGRCREDGGAPPYWPWAQVVRILASGRSLPLSDVASEDIAGLLNPDPAPAGTAFRLFESVGAVLAAAADEHALLVVLDDLHRADEPSLGLLGYLSVSLADLPIVVLACFRDTDLKPDDPLSILLGSVEGSTTASLMLRGLDVDSLAELVRLVCGGQVGEDIAAEVASRSGGNPLFAVELARSMAAGGGETLTALPPTVRSLIRQRVRRLPPETERALRVASVLGRSFGGLPLAAVLGCSELAAIGALQPAAGVQLISSDIDGRYRFVHAVIQETLYAELGIEERVASHRRAAAALAAVTERTDEIVADTAFHSYEGAVAGDTALALAATREAGRRAASRKAYEDAERWFGLAIGLEGRDGPLPSAVVLEVADAALRAGHRAQARKWYETAAGLARSAGDAQALTRAAMGVGATVVTAGTVDWDLVELLQDALVAVGSDRALRAELTSRLAVELYWNDRGEKARALSAEALRLGEASGDQRAVGVALHARQFTLRSPDFLADRIEIGRRAVALADSLGDKDLGFQAHAWLAADVLRTAHVGGFQGELDALDRIAERSQEPLHRWYALLYRSEVAAIRGEAVSAWAVAEEAAVLGARLGVPVAGAYRVGQLSVLARDLGRWSDLEADVRDAVEKFPYFVTLRAILVLLLADTGHRVAATVELDRLSPERFAAVPPDSLWVATIGLLAEAAAITRSRHLPVLRELLEPYCGEILVQGLPACWGAVDRVLGVVAAGCGDFDEARQRLEHAAETHQRMGAVGWLARTRLDQSRLAGAVDSQREAAAFAEEATSLAAAAGLEGIVAACVGEHRGVSATARSLSTREREVIALLAGGASNKDIARELVVSINTVERHLVNIYAKLGVRGRAEATAFAVRNGLA